jgi:predicted nucleic acid-binding protein
LIVVDASVALAWCYSDERTEAVLHVFKLVATDGAVAPSVWPLEIANSLQVAVRKKRITRPYRDALLVNFRRLAVEIDQQTAVGIWGEVLGLADRHELTVYDASYLELALRLGLPLASLDQNLRRAALSESVAVLP